MSLSVPEFAAVLALVVAITIAVGEIVCRWAFRRSRFYSVYVPGTRQRIEPDVATHPTLERAVTYHINRDGERGPEPPRDRTGVYRILVTGGSAAEGILNDQATCWPMQLQQQLSTPERLARLGRRAVHVGTIGRSGFDVAALALAHERILPRYERLDALIVLAGAGDVMRWLAARAPETDGTWECTLHETFACYPERPFEWTPRRLALTEVYRLVRGRLVVTVHRNAATWMGRARRARVAAFERGEMLDTVPDPSILLDRYEVHLTRALQLARRHADRVIVMIQPALVKPTLTPEERAHLWNGGTGQAYREVITTFYSDRVIADLLAAVNERTRLVASQVGVEVVDPAPALEIGLRHFYDHLHFTHAGAAAVAGVLAEYLAGLVTPRGADAPAPASQRALLPPIS